MLNLIEATIFPAYDFRNKVVSASKTVFINVSSIVSVENYSDDHYELTLAKGHEPSVGFPIGRVLARLAKDKHFHFVNL